MIGTPHGTPISPAPSSHRLPTATEPLSSQTAGICKYQSVTRREDVRESWGFENRSDILEIVLHRNPSFLAFGTQMDFGLPMNIAQAVSNTDSALAYVRVCLTGSSWPRRVTPVHTQGVQAPSSSIFLPRQRLMIRSPHGQNGRYVFSIR